MRPGPRLADIRTCDNPGLGFCLIHGYAVSSYKEVAVGLSQQPMYLYCIFFVFLIVRPYSMIDIGF
jgi:hypothetical protein